ncbi:unnamed protein product [Gulo gulo]|uniref:Uncharacterized protein n=1 Tax=Gulo gulo TaxID=48420 RepID=A0A9X9LG60_GULGU|nr:unnamed protein product [Gulo gulo]
MPLFTNMACTGCWDDPILTVTHQSRLIQQGWRDFGNLEVVLLMEKSEQDLGAILHMLGKGSYIGKVTTILELLPSPFWDQVGVLIFNEFEGNSDHHPGLTTIDPLPNPVPLSILPVCQVKSFLSWNTMHHSSGKVAQINKQQFTKTNYGKCQMSKSF